MNCPDSAAYAHILRISLWQENNIMPQLKTELGHGIVVGLLDRKLSLYDVQTFNFGVVTTEALDYFLHSFWTPIDL